MSNVKLGSSEYKLFEVIGLIRLGIKSAFALEADILSTGPPELSLSVGCIPKLISLRTNASRGFSEKIYPSVNAIGIL